MLVIRSDYIVINMELYKIFYFAAKSGSISKAAEKLYITQPAVSQAIKHLESQLGGKVFFRTPRGVVLTEEGKILYKYIEQAYNFIMTAENKFLEMQNLMNGEIKIGASDTLCKYYLLPYLSQFHSDYPNIKIQVTNRITQETISLLKVGKVDLGIINLPINNDKKLIIKEVFPVQDCFVCGDKYKDLSESPISLNKLLEYPILLLDKGSTTRKFLDEFIESQGVNITPEIELGSIDLLVSFAKIGLGISCVVKDFVKDELDSSNLHEIKLIEKIPKRNIGIITLKDVPLSNAAKKFIELLHIT